MEKFVQRITPEYIRNLLLQKDSFPNDFLNSTVASISVMADESTEPPAHRCKRDYGGFYKAAVSEIPEELKKVLTYNEARIIDNDCTQEYLQRASNQRDKYFDTMCKDHGRYAVALYKHMTDNRYITLTGEQLSAAIELGVDFKKVKLACLLNTTTNTFGGLMNRMFPPVIGYLDSNIKKLSKGDLKNAVTAKYGFAKLEMRNFRHDTLIEFINIQDRNRLYYTCDFEMEECLDRTIYGMYDRFIPLSGPKKSNRISYILFNQKELVAEIEKKLSFLESTPEKRMTRKEIFEKYGVVVSD